MKVFRHHDITNHHKLVALARLLENVQKQVPPPCRALQWTPTITTARDEVQFPGVIVAFETRGHDGRLVRLRNRVCDERTEDAESPAASLPHSIAKNAIEWGTPRLTWATRQTLSMEGTAIRKNQLVMTNSALTYTSQGPTQ